MRPSILSKSVDELLQAGESATDRWPGANGENIINWLLETMLEIRKRAVVDDTRKHRLVRNLACVDTMSRGTTYSWCRETYKPLRARLFQVAALTMSLPPSPIPRSP